MLCFLFYLLYQIHVDNPGSVTQKAVANVGGTDGPAKRQLPQSIIIGFSKCGTRALLRYLQLHPNIEAAKREINFFQIEENYNKGLEWYRDKMPAVKPSQMAIEKSPEYIHSKVASERMKAMNGSLKLILNVCDPIRRSVSEYTQKLYDLRALNKRMPPFEELALNSDKNSINADMWWIRRSRYSDFLPFWLNHFKLDQIHIVDGDALRENPVPEVNEVEDFLGLPRTFSEGHIYFNKTKGFYCMRSEGEGSGCLADSKGRQHPDIDKDMLERLSDYFRPYNEKFFSMVDRTFEWD